MNVQVSATKDDLKERSSPQNKKDDSDCTKGEKNSDGSSTFSNFSNNSTLISMGDEKEIFEDDDLSFGETTATKSLGSRKDRDYSDKTGSMSLSSSSSPKLVSSSITKETRQHVDLSFGDNLSCDIILEEENESDTSSQNTNRFSRAGEAEPKTKFESVSWLIQMKWLLYKNMLLLYRKPVESSILMLSSLVCTLLAVITTSYPLLKLYMGIYGGPLVHAVFVFPFVHMEIEAELIGVLRSLGVRDSAYWFSWFLVFMISSTINATLGTIIVSVCPFKDNLPNAIILFVFYFALNITITTASFAIAAVCGRHDISIIILPIALFGSIYLPIRFSSADDWHFSQDESNIILKLLLFATLIYMTSAWYWMQIFTAENGKRKPIFFFLFPKYWCKCFSSTCVLENGCLTIDRVSKHFQHGLWEKTKAVDDITFEMERGEITALLGRNGSGKSTLCSIISSEMSASSGSFTAFGFDLLSEKASNIRHHLIGKCKQDNILWDNLSSQEHLQLYAGLRGENEINSLVKESLESVHMMDISTHMINSFSIGMKRRLSVVLATIGSCPLIILDEPTTGVDPLHRQHIWNHIEKMKRDRAILLVTHSMEEADLLSDNVIVMCDGKKVTNGTPLDLKARYGKVFQFSIIVNNNAMKANVLKKCHEVFSTDMNFVRLNDNIKDRVDIEIGSIKDEFHRSHGVEISKIHALITWVEKEDYCTVNEIGSFSGSLEEVFLSISDDYEDDVLHSSQSEGQDQREYLDEDKHSPSIYDQVLALLKFTMRRKWHRGGIRGSLIEFSAYITCFLFCLGFPTLARDATYNGPSKYF